MQAHGWIDTVATSPTGRAMTVTISDHGVDALASARHAWTEAQRGVVQLLGPGAPPTLDTRLELITQE